MDYRKIAWNLTKLEDEIIEQIIDEYDNEHEFEEFANGFCQWCASEEWSDEWFDIKLCGRCQQRLVDESHAVIQEIMDNGIKGLE